MMYFVDYLNLAGTYLFIYRDNGDLYRISSDFLNEEWDSYEEFYNYLRGKVV